MPPRKAKAAKRAERKTPIRRTPVDLRVQTLERQVRELARQVDNLTTQLVKLEGLQAANIRDVADAARTIQELREGKASVVRN
jgi:hypothetical protein